MIEPLGWFPGNSIDDCELAHRRARDGNFLGEDADDLQTMRPVCVNSQSIHLDGTNRVFGKRLRLISADVFCWHLADIETRRYHVSF